MEAFLNRYRNLTVLLLVVAAQVLLLGYQVKSNQDVRLVRIWAVTAVTPLARVLEFVRRNTIGIAEDYFVLINVRDENNRLSKEVGRLKLENQFLRTELQTADRARALAAFQSRTPSRTIAARIIGNGTGTNSRVVFIDRGSSSGIEAGMAVVTPDGIVGKVLASYPTASQVLLVNDANFAAGVISQKNRVHGTVKGTGQSKLIVDYVQNEEKVEVGEIFYTSGDDRIFPKGMPVGTVSVVRPGRNFKEIFLVPSGTQNGIEEVLIVLEGVHQAIPDAANLSASGYSVLPAPPPTQTPAKAQTGVDPMSRASQTEADRLRERYKRIGEAQNHVFGEGAPGSKPPNFNLDPDKVKPAPPAPATPGGATAAPRPSTTNPAAPPSGAQPRPTIERPPSGAVTQSPSGTATTLPVTSPAVSPSTTQPRPASERQPSATTTQNPPGTVAKPPASKPVTPPATTQSRPGAERQPAATVTHNPPSTVGPEARGTAVPAQPKGNAPSKKQPEPPRTSPPEP